jgi:RHS repeat-associated protein
MILNELDGGGTTKASYYITAGFAPAGIITSNANRWPLHDALGSVLALTDDDGVVTDAYNYRDFGEVVDGTGVSYNPFRFSGQYYESDVKLAYLRARYYDPTAGRFISVDPINLISGRLAPYAYTNNRPSNLVDPSGLAAVPFDPGPLPGGPLGKLVFGLNWGSMRAEACREMHEECIITCLYECPMRLSETQLVLCVATCTVLEMKCLIDGQWPGSVDLLGPLL